MLRRQFHVHVENTEVYLENSALIKCAIPEYVRPYVRVASWHRGEEILLPESADIGECCHNFSHADIHFHMSVLTVQCTRVGFYPYLKFMYTYSNCCLSCFYFLFLFRPFCWRVNHEGCSVATIAGSVDIYCKRFYFLSVLCWLCFSQFYKLGLLSLVILQQAATWFWLPPETCIFVL